nr:hypothetical protein [Tanacetum cinerariifolium]
MSDASSAVTYTFPIASPSPDYVPGPEHPLSADYVPCLEHLPSPIEIPYIPESEYPEYLESSVDEVPFEDQPLSADALPITTSPDYVADSDPKKDPEEDPEDDEADYPTDGGDGDDEHSDDDDTDDEDPEEEPFEEDDKEEEEHLAPTDSSAVPIVDLTHLRSTRKTIKPELPMSASMKACIARHVTLPSPPLLIPSLPLPFPSPLTTCPTDTGAPLGYRAAGIRMRALLLSTSCRTDIPEANIPPQKRACLTTPALGFKIRESSAAGAARQLGPIEFNLRRSRVKKAGYGITDMWDEIVNKLIEIASATLKGLNERVTELETTVRQRTDKFDIRFEEAQDDRALLIAQVNTLFRDRLDPHPTAMLIDRETQLTMALGRIKILEARDPKPQEGPAEAGSSCVAAALAKHDANRSRKGDNSNDSGTCRRRQMTTPREFSYIDFLKCQSMSFQGTEGVDVAYAIPWATLKRMITDKYCLRGKIQKLESKYWNLKVKGINLLNYNHRFQELALMCDKNEAIEFATEMMDKKMLTHAERHVENNRKIDDTSRNTHINNSHLKGITWHGCTLLGKEIRNLIEGPNLYVPSVIIITMGPVHRSAPTGPMIVKADLLLPTTTTRTTPITKTTTIIHQQPKQQQQLEGPRGKCKGYYLL